jgi:hypothetical protein
MENGIYTFDMGSMLILFPDEKNLQIVILYKFSKFGSTANKAPHVLQ